MKIAFFLSALPLATAFAPKQPSMLSNSIKMMKTKLDVAPKPTYEIDFSDPDSANIPEPYILAEGAEILEGAPGPFAKALRIASDGPYAKLPGIDLSPSKRAESTLAISIYLESIPKDSFGWVLNTENGKFDRAIIMHDDRFNGIGFGTGTMKGGKVFPEKTLPETGKWVQYIATFRQNGDCNMFIDGEKAPITQKGKNNSGENAITIGRVTRFPKHWCDCWVKDVAVFDRALNDEEAVDFFNEYKDDMLPTPPPAPVPDVIVVPEAPVTPQMARSSNSNIKFMQGALFVLSMMFLTHA